MAFNVYKYLPKKKRNYFHFLKYLCLITIRWYRLRAKTINNILIKVLKVLWELLYYGVIYFIGTSFVYNGYEAPQVPQWLLTMVLLMLFVQHKSMKYSYKTWEKLAEVDEFQALFIKRYSIPLFLPQFILLFVFAAFCSFGSFIILYLAITTYDTWERRYITNDIKQDMVFKELKKLNN